MPLEVIEALLHSENTRFDEADVLAAKRVLADEPGWLVPSVSGDQCLVRLVYPVAGFAKNNTLPPIPLWNCVSRAAAQAGHLIETQVVTLAGTKPLHTKVIGIVPDGTQEVYIATRGGRRLVVPVNQNAYEAIVENPVSVRFTVAVGKDKYSERVVPLATFNARNLVPQKVASLG